MLCRGILSVERELIPMISLKVFFCVFVWNLGCNCEGVSR
jgi:hypothetical protein